VSKVFGKTIKLGVIAACLAAATPAFAGWKLVPPDAPVTLGKLQVTPMQAWNSASAKPGQQGAAWTQDGFDLNELDVFAGVPGGKSIYRERNAKRDPMPKFAGNMLLIDLADLFERSFRAGKNVTDFTLLETAPAKLASEPALHIRYAYSLPGEELARKGEARLAIIGGALYMIAFQAPARSPHRSSAAPARVLMDGARLTSK
jgi:hypothetical protein